MDVWQALPLCLQILFKFIMFQIPDESYIWYVDRINDTQYLFWNTTSYLLYKQNKINKDSDIMFVKYVSTCNLLC